MEKRKKLKQRENKLSKAEEQGEGEEELVSGGGEVNDWVESTFLNHVLIWISLVYVAISTLSSLILFI